jgi:hypothetical protein
MILLRKFCVLPVFMMLCAGMEVQDEPFPAQPTPQLYVTTNYGLMAKIPNGLTYCRLPDGWTGSDHGTVLVLDPPSGCIPSHSYPSSDRPTPEFVPAISLYYEHNVADIERANGDSSPPRTSAEYVKQSCEKPYARIPAGLTLLGRPGVGCRRDDGDRVEIAMAALFWSGREGVIVTLSTTLERLSRDSHMLARVTSGLSVCKPEWDKSTRRVPACPDAPWW